MPTNEVRSDKVRSASWSWYDHWCRLVVFTVSSCCNFFYCISVHRLITLHSPCLLLCIVGLIHFWYIGTL